MRLGAIASPPKTPCILGFECAGEVEAIGEGVTDFQVGDRVCALPEFKAWAELVAVSEKFVYKIPDAMSYSEAAAITLSYLVAYVIVFDLAAIKPGNSVLLHSAGGGVVSTTPSKHFFFVCLFIDQNILVENRHDSTLFFIETITIVFMAHKRCLHERVRSLFNEHKDRRRRKWIFLLCILCMFGCVE